MDFLNISGWRNPTDDEKQAMIWFFQEEREKTRKHLLWDTLLIALAAYYIGQGIGMDIGEVPGYIIAFALLFAIWGLYLYRDSKRFDKRIDAIRQDRCCVLSGKPFSIALGKSKRAATYVSVANDKGEHTDAEYPIFDVSVEEDMPILLLHIEKEVTGQEINRAFTPQMLGEE